MSENEDPPGGYKLLLVPTSEIIELTEGPPQTATVAAESSVCNCDRFRAGPFAVVTPDRCRFAPAGCPTERERELLRYAQAMDYALTHVRRLAVESQVRGEALQAEAVLHALTEPYRFPLPGDAEALAAYRKVFEEGNLAILHLAGCDRCNPIGYDRDTCSGYDAAAWEDARAAHREASLRSAGVAEGTIRMMRP